jgi:hypothetical protein
VRRHCGWSNTGITFARQFGAVKLSSPRFPGVSAESVVDSMTSVNALRLMLRHYFAADLHPLGEASYRPNHSSQVDFVRVTGE